jgi:hypothetical protein
MWYFIIKQPELTHDQYVGLQKKAKLTEVEVYNEPYTNLCLFEVERDRYKEFVDYLDLEGVRYDVASDRPSRSELLESMQ